MDFNFRLALEHLAHGAMACLCTCRQGAKSTPLQGRGPAGERRGLTLLLVWTGLSPSCPSPPPPLLLLWRLES